MISKNNFSGKIPTIRKTNDTNDIQNLIPSKLNCNIFSVYDYEGMTIQEILCAFFTKINECIEHVNKTLDLVEWLVSVGLKEEVANQLKDWLDDGTLDEIIGDLFETLTSKLEGIEKKIPTLETKLSNVENEIPKIDNRLNNIEKLTCNIFPTDAIEKINSKIADTKYNKYIFHSGEYHVTKSNYIKIHRDNIEIDFLPNAIIIQNDYLEPLYVMLEIRKCKNVVINNPQIDGKMPSSIPPDDLSGGDGIGSWGYGVEVTRSQNISIFNANIKSTTGDGIYMGLKWDEGETVTDINENILVDGFLIDKVSRNGIAICGGKNIYVKNGKVSNIKRSLPRAAIDIEPENSLVSNLVLDNVYISNVISERNDLALGLATRVNDGGNIYIENITSIEESSTLGAFGWDVPKGRLIINNITCVRPKAYVMNFHNIINHNNIFITNVNIKSKLEQANETYLTRNSMFFFSNSTDENVGGIHLSNVNYQCIEPYNYLRTGYFESGKWNNITFTSFKGNNLPPIYNAPFENKTFKLIDTIITDYDITTRKFMDLRSLVNKVQFEWDLVENHKIDFMATIPDGEYEIGYNINTGGHSFQIAFDERYQIFLNGEKNLENNIITTKPIMLLKFIKNGTLLNIKSFFPLQ